MRSSEKNVHFTSADNVLFPKLRLANIVTKFVWIVHNNICTCFFSSFQTLALLKTYLLSLEISKRVRYLHSVLP